MAATGRAIAPPLVKAHVEILDDHLECYSSGFPGFESLLSDVDYVAHCYEYTREQL
jgi:hypothetical protein